jgi:hypothetical protein
MLGIALGTGDAEMTNVLDGVNHILDSRGEQKCRCIMTKVTTLCVVVLEIWTLNLNAWIQILALPLSSCVTLDKLLNFSVSTLFVKGRSSLYQLHRVVGVNIYEYVGKCLKHSKCYIGIC